MHAFNIVNMASGDELGRYYADTAAEALDALARYAGFENFAKACEAKPWLSDELAVDEL